MACTVIVRRIVRVRAASVSLPITEVTPVCRLVVILWLPAPVLVRLVAPFRSSWSTRERNSRTFARSKTPNSRNTAPTSCSVSKAIFCMHITKLLAMASFFLVVRLAEDPTRPTALEMDCHPPWISTPRRKKRTTAKATTMITVWPVWLPSSSSMKTLEVPVMISKTYSTMVSMLFRVRVFQGSTLLCRTRKLATTISSMAACEWPLFGFRMGTRAIKKDLSISTDPHHHLSTRNRKSKNRKYWQNMGCIADSVGAFKFATAQIEKNPTP
mmetsp:Transcript_6436/g.15783  ORF Transcript_6436/g.15783 Transcript_6436/m.15783 type:complete len:270 (-) Transcript_6436:413-1222(-)